MEQLVAQKAERCCLSEKPNLDFGETAARPSFCVCRSINRYPFWPKTDMPKNAINVAIGGKADMSLCAAHVRF
jgi:hypothetical protein